MFGDPVLKQRAAEVTDIDGRLARLADDMIDDDVRRARPRPGRAAGRRAEAALRLRPADDGPADARSTRSISEPRASGSTTRAASRCPGCPGRSSARRRSTSSGYDLDGNEVSIEADELLARLFQHELDHLDGVLLLERLDDDQRKAGDERAGRASVQEIERRRAPAEPSRASRLASLTR